MSTGDCLAYFEDYGPSMVEWINDSSCECGRRGCLGWHDLQVQRDQRTTWWALVMHWSLIKVQGKDCACPTCGCCCMWLTALHMCCADAGNVVFADEATTLRAMMGRGQPIPPDIAPPPEGEAGMPGPQLAGGLGGYRGRGLSQLPCTLSEFAQLVCAGVGGERTGGTSLLLLTSCNSVPLTCPPIHPPAPPTHPPGPAHRPTRGRPCLCALPVVPRRRLHAARAEAHQADIPHGHHSRLQRPPQREGEPLPLAGGHAGCPQTLKACAWQTTVHTSVSLHSLVGHSHAANAAQQMWTPNCSC